MRQPKREFIMSRHNGEPVLMVQETYSSLTQEEVLAYMDVYGAHEATFSGGTVSYRYPTQAEIEEYERMKK